MNFRVGSHNTLLSSVVVLVLTEESDLGTLLPCLQVPRRSMPPAHRPTACDHVHIQGHIYYYTRSRGKWKMTKIYPTEPLSSYHRPTSTNAEATSPLSSTANPDASTIDLQAAPKSAGRTRANSGVEAPPSTPRALATPAPGPE